MAKCKRLTRGAADHPNEFNTWWVNNGRPDYLGRSHKWVKRRVSFTTGAVTMVTVGWSITEDSDVWNHATCMSRYRFG